MLRGFRHREAEADLATLGSSTSFALGALLRSFVGAKTADFLKDAFHLELGLQALQSAVDRLTFADLDFGHGLEKKGWG